MEEELEKIWNHMHEAPEREQIKLFLEYCDKLVEYKDKGECSEEFVGYRVTGIGLQFDAISDSNIFEDLLSVASDMEWSRNISYKQDIDSWNAERAEDIKSEEWKMFLKALAEAHAQYGKQNTEV
ncbi:MAG TPA: hypothetical protein VGE63_01865 [Candidatus Paceibacterota bacterium]